MIVRHTNQLLLRLDDLYIKGITFVSWGEIYYWYDADRINKGIWRDIKWRWDELLEDKNKNNTKVQVIETQVNQGYYFIHGDMGVTLEKRAK